MTKTLASLVPWQRAVLSSSLASRSELTYPHTVVEITHGKTQIRTEQNNNKIHSIDATGLFYFDKSIAG